MDHPNIARVLDGGALPPTAPGRPPQPFFVMEFVDGAPILNACDAARLDIRERLQLFIAVCRAVQHAHQKGDHSPRSETGQHPGRTIDGHGVPKVIDFGVAKADRREARDDLLSTQVGSVVGTLEYMAPEQAGVTGDDIDTRADIYSLGVILYELLVGLRPLDAARLRQLPMTEVLRAIRDEEPLRPSTRLQYDPTSATFARSEAHRTWAVDRLLARRTRLRSS